MHLAVFMVSIASIIALGCSAPSEPTWTPIPTWTPVPTWTPIPTSSPDATGTPALIPHATATPTPAPNVEEQAILAVRRYFSAYSSGNSERLARTVTRDSQAGAVGEMRLFQPHGISIKIQSFDLVDCDVTIERCIVIVTTTNEDILGEWTAPEALEVVKESGVWKVRWSL